jgi:putative FmdB family regulatory protein
MPTYEYQCQECGNRFEVFATIRQKSAGILPECPECHSTLVRQAFGSLVLIRDASGRIPPAGSSACCPGGAKTECC